MFDAIQDIASRVINKKYYLLENNLSRLLSEHLGKTVSYYDSGYVDKIHVKNVRSKYNWIWDIEIYYYKDIPFAGVGIYYIPDNKIEVCLLNKQQIIDVV